MFHSMHMHSSWVIALIALVLLVVVSGSFLAIRVVGQRIFDSEAAVPRKAPPDDAS